MKTIDKIEFLEEIEKPFTIQRLKYLLDLLLEKALANQYTKNDLMDKLEKKAAEYLLEAPENLKRNRHHNNLTDQDFKKISKKAQKRWAEAVLIGFLNTTVPGWGICPKDLKKPK